MRMLQAKTYHCFSCFFTGKSLCTEILGFFFIVSFIYLVICLFMYLNFWLHPIAYGIFVPPPGIKPALSALEGGVLATGLPGRSLKLCSLFPFC